MNQCKTEVTFVKFLHEYLGGPTMYAGQTLSARDRKVATDALKIWFCILRDLCVEVLGEKANEGRIRKAIKLVSGVDLIELLTALDRANEWMLQSVADRSLRDYQAFKQSVIQEDSSTELMRIVLGLCKPLVLSWFRSRDVAGFANARQVFVFLGRLNLQDDSRLADAAYQQWWQSEITHRDKVDISGDEKNVISEWFPLENTALIAEYFAPHHGAGSTYERVRAGGEKYLLNGWDENIIAAFRIMGWDPSFSDTMAKPFFPLPGQPFGVCPPSRHMVQFVPKNWKTYRTVSKEPVAYQFMQLGALAAIARYLKQHHASLWRHYCIDTEHLNRDLAKEGSIDGHFATLDLSAASDSVALALVSDWFDESALGFLTRLLRTEYARFDMEIYLNGTVFTLDDLIRVGKFAPMGSGLCFIIESIVFGAVIELAVRTTPGADRRWAIYGDDIVCDVLIAQKVIKRLTDLNFKVNVTKSFFNEKTDDVTDFFRESCGGEYLNGYDVTPKRISRKFSGLSCWKPCKKGAKAETDPHSIAQLITLANVLSDFRTARRLVVSSLLEQHIPVLFDEDGLHGVKSPCPTNYHLKHRWNDDYQRWEVYAAVLVTRYKGLEYNEESYLGEVRLFEYLRLAEQSNRKHLLYPEDMVNVRVDPYSAVATVRYQWVEPPSTPVQTLSDRQ